MATISERLPCSNCGQLNNKSSLWGFAQRCSYCGGVVTGGRGSWVTVAVLTCLGLACIALKLYASSLGY
jgi:hypothetical protein